MDSRLPNGLPKNCTEIQKREDFDMEESAKTSKRVIHLSCSGGAGFAYLKKRAFFIISSRKSFIPFCGAESAGSVFKQSVQRRSLLGAFHVQMILNFLEGVPR